MRRRRHNPERVYYVKDGYSKHMEEFGSLRSAIKYAMRVGDFVSADDVIKHIYVERDETYIPLAQASRSAARVVAEYANRNPMKRRRNCRNPSHVRSILGGRDRAEAKRVRAGSMWHKHARQQKVRYLMADAASPRRSHGKKARRQSKWARVHDKWQNKIEKSWMGGRSNPGHPSYAQHLMRLGLHHGDPIIELASVWAAGQDAGTRLIKQALVSAEHWRESKDKRLRQAMTSVVNKLQDYLGHAERREERRAPKVHRTIHPAWRTNPSCSNPYPHEHAARLISPTKAVKGSYRRKNVKGGSIGLMMAKKRRGGPMTLFSVRFRAAHFTPAQARAWLKRHKLKPVLFEAATQGRKAAWKAEGTRARRGKARRRSRFTRAA